MDVIRITGGTPLYGTVSIQGSKNAALPMMAAALLCRGISVLKGCPRIADVFWMEKILRELGAVTWWEAEDLYMDCTAADKTGVPGEYTAKMRSSVILMGALLGRSGSFRMGYPGGCVIGERPIDLHLEVLRKLGAVIHEDGGRISAFSKELRGGRLVFPFKSVGATEQGILSAVLARGETILENCACEPEIVWLCRYLEGMGARISGAGGSCIAVRGVKTLEGGNMRVPPDRIVAGTYICAGAATRGIIELERAPVEELQSFLELYRKMGGQFKVKRDKLIADSTGISFPLDFVKTEVYPGFPTDLQSPLMAVLTTIPGKSHIREKIFEDRFKTAGELNRMGARIFVKGPDAWIFGGAPLSGCAVQARELRGGAALVIAGLAAGGITSVKGGSFIRRGYEHIEKDLSGLGGNIETDGGSV